MTKSRWNGRKPPCYEYLPDSHTYVFHVSEEKSVEISGNDFILWRRFEEPSLGRSPLVRLLTGVSTVQMLSDPARWARFYGSKTAEDRE